MKIIRSWLIVKLKDTNKVIILKRSKKSRNSKQWDFIGGSGKWKKLNPRKLIRKESREEIGFKPPRLSLRGVVFEKLSIYYYFITEINQKQFDRLKLSKEHSNLKLVSLHKLRNHKKLHHSIRIFLKNN